MRGVESCPAGEGGPPPDLVDALALDAAVADLETELRTVCPRGRVIVSSGVASLPDADQLAIVQMVRDGLTLWATCTARTPNLGLFEHDEALFYWVVDERMAPVEDWAAEDCLVLTVLTADEY